ncbi:MAG: methyl-accepting chemotaxis protein [Desulfuromonadales bacterium]|nr:methyl-accepting chemotaxis protein [Desulfuromonadales bacterium]
MKFFRSLRTKIWICVWVAFAGYLLATVYTFSSNNRLSSHLTELQDYDFPLALKGGEALNTFQKQGQLYEDAFLLGDEEAVAAGNTLSADILGLIDTMLVLNDESARRQSNRQHLTEVRARYTQYARQASATYQRILEGDDHPSLQQEIGALGQVKAALLDDFETIAQRQVAQAGEEIENGKNIARQNTKVLLILFPTVLVLAALIINIISSRLLISPLRRIQATVRSLAEGRLDQVQPIGGKARDEIGELAADIDDMAAKLSSMVQRIHGSSAELARIATIVGKASVRVDESFQSQVAGVENTSSAVAQIRQSVDRIGGGVEQLSGSAAESTSSVLEMTAANEEVAQNMESLAGAVDEVSSSIAEMAASIRQVADSTRILKDSTETSASSILQVDASIKEVEENARGTAAITNEVRKDAQEGQAAVNETIQGMGAIRAAAETAAQVIHGLSEKAQSIGSILSVIENVTEQTNLLALNAAIIAAQAGEHGRGFAVVATEIRELAERTNHSTREIAKVIDGVREETGRAVEAITGAERRVVEGEALSNRSGAALTKIVAGAQKAADSMDKIVLATREQALGSRAIRMAAEKISENVTQIATAAREQNQGTEQIMGAAVRMREMTLHVQGSTREQSQGSKVIARSMEEISEMIRQIREACGEQKVDSDSIAGAVEKISHSARANLDSAKVLKEAVGLLGKETQELETEIGMFQTGG